MSYRVDCHEIITFPKKWAGAMKIQNVADRERLPVRPDPYWVKVSKGCYLGYRKTSGSAPGNWLARCQSETDKREFRKLGDFSLIPGSDRHDAALKLARDWFKHIGQGGTNDDATVADVCNRYVEALAADGKQKAAKDAKRRFTVYVLDEARLAKTDIQKLTREQVIAWRKRLAKRPIDSGARVGQLRSDSSLNRDMTPFRAALNLALSDDLLTSDSAWLKPLLPIKNADRQRDVYLDLDQRRELSKAASADLKGLIQAAMLLPIRPGALALLTVGDFDKRRGTLRIGKDKTGGRSISLPPATIAHLAAQTADKLPTAPLISTAAGKAWNKDSWKKPFKTAAQTAGLMNVTLYALRHSAITDMVHDGMDLLTVAQLSGTSLKMIELHYGHLIPGRGATALKVLTL